MDPSNIHYLIYSVTLVVIITMVLLFVSGAMGKWTQKDTRDPNTTDDSSTSYGSTTPKEK